MAFGVFSPACRCYVPAAVRQHSTPGPRRPEDHAFFTTIVLCPALGTVLNPLGSHVALLQSVGRLRGTLASAKPCSAAFSAAVAARPPQPSSTFHDVEAYTQMVSGLSVIVGFVKKTCDGTLRLRNNQLFRTA